MLMLDNIRNNFRRETRRQEQDNNKKSDNCYLGLKFSIFLYLPTNWWFCLVFSFNKLKKFFQISYFSRLGLIFSVFCTISNVSISFITARMKEFFSDNIFLKNLIRSAVIVFFRRQSF